jgi:hypothetical protein
MSAMATQVVVMVYKFGNEKVDFCLFKLHIRISLGGGARTPTQADGISFSAGWAFCPLIVL